MDFVKIKNAKHIKKKFCSPFGFGTFDLIKDLEANNKKCPKCPACEYLLLKLESVGFLKCKYKYVGKKYEKGKIVEVNYSKKTRDTDDYLDYVDTGKKGENKSLWVELKISASKL